MATEQVQHRPAKASQAVSEPQDTSDREAMLARAKTAEAEVLAPLIRTEHQASNQAMEDGLAHAIQCGEYLAKAKKLVAHGQWGMWVKENCGFTSKTASNYMRLWERQDDIPERAEISYRRALTRLSTKQPSSKKSGKSQAKKKRAVVTKTELREALNKHLKSRYEELVDRPELLKFLKALGVVVK